MLLFAAQRLDLPALRNRLGCIPYLSCNCYLYACIYVGLILPLLFHPPLHLRLLPIISLLLICFLVDVCLLCIGILILDTMNARGFILLMILKFACVGNISYLLFLLRSCLTVRIFSSVVNNGIPYLNLIKRYVVS